MMALMLRTSSIGIVKKSWSSTVKSAYFPASSVPMVSSASMYSEAQVVAIFSAVTRSIASSGSSTWETG